MTAARTQAVRARSVLVGACRVERRAQRLQRAGQLARDHPDRVARALGELRQGLQVLVGEQLGVGVVLVNRLEHGPNGLRLALGAQDRPLLLTLGAQDVPLLVAVGGQDLRLAEALGGEGRRAPLPLCPPLPLPHGGDALWRGWRPSVPPGGPAIPPFPEAVS